MGRASVEAVLRLSAEALAGPPHPGKKGGAVGWHGSESGTVALSERKLRVRRPRLRKKRSGPDGEVPVPAYEAMQRDGKLGSRMLEILLRGVSTRQYQHVLPEMAQAVGVSRSAVSREAIEASAAQLAALLERRWDDVDLLVIYIDGQQHGEHHVISAVGVDSSGKKHVLGIQEGATENATAAKALLIHLREHGVDTRKNYLFVIDGAKALRTAIREVFGAGPAVHRCRTHKVRNVLDELPKEQYAQVRSLLRAAYKMENAAEGMARMEKLAQWIERRLGPRPSSPSRTRQSRSLVATLSGST